jgi:hypothetical protein
MLLFPQERQTPFGIVIVGVTNKSWLCEHLQVGIVVDGVCDGVGSIFGFTFSSSIDPAFFAAIEASFPSKSFRFLLFLPTFNDLILPRIRVIRHILNQQKTLSQNQMGQSFSECYIPIQNREPWFSFLL